MSGLVLDGRVVPVPGVTCVSWLDDPTRCPQATDFYRFPRRPCRPLTADEAARRQPPPWIRGIVLHTVHGADARAKGGKLRSGLGGPSQRDLWYAQYQARTPRDVSWDLTIDTDGTVAVSNDPLEHVTWHAGSVNPATLGIELVQESDGSLYEGQLEVLVRVVDVLTRELRIQRQLPVRDGRPIAGVFPRLGKGGNDRGGRTVVGIYGHRNQTTNRGWGDPTDWPVETLHAAGYQALDFAHDEDRAIWRERQRVLGLDEVDGIAGPATVAALERAGHAHGLWVTRPGD